MSVGERTPGLRRVVASPRAVSATWRPGLGRLALWALPVLLIGLLTWPMTLRSDVFGADWGAHLWFVRHQAQTLLHDHHPSLFVHYDDGVFYPHYAFYGGTLYAVAGVASAVLGGAGRDGYVVSWIAALAASYGGWVWLGRMAGLGRWTAQAPAVLFVTSPYLITSIYTTGDWPELVAVSSIPLLVASGVSVLRADRLRVLPALALAASTILFTGSHNITLLWGGTFLVVVGACLGTGIPQVRRQVTRQGALRVAGIVVPALLVNAWFLMPDIAYQAQTMISARYPTRGYVEGRMDLVGLGHLLSLHRRSADSEIPQFVLTLPVLAMGWLAVAAGLLARRGWGAPWLRALALLTALVAALLILMTHAGLLLALPKPYVMIQFTYRLESYILLGLCGGVLAALVLLREAGRRVRRWTWVLVPVLAASVAGAIAQVGDFTVWPVAGTFDAPSISSMGQFTDATTPEAAARPRPRIAFPPGGVHRDRLTVTAPLSPGQQADTNLMVMPAMLHVDGARIVGAHTLPPDGNVDRRLAVLQVDRDATPGAAKITVRAAHPLPVVAGQVLSLLGVLGLLANFLALLVRRRRRAAVASRPTGIAQSP
ncbi:MAG TPA: hypothetical protein VGO71_21000 [Baekduia sp.]|nr:hypothetical protein [Baekduia sp.]